MHPAMKGARYTKGQNAFCVCVGGSQHFTAKDLEWILPDLEYFFDIGFSETASHRAVNLVGLLTHHHYTRIAVRPIEGVPISAAYDGSYVYWFRGRLEDLQLYSSQLEIKL